MQAPPTTEQYSKSFHFKTTHNKFADDTKLIHPIATNEDSNEMQQDINHLQNWADDWQMRYNAGKYGFVQFWFNNLGHTYHVGNTDLSETTKEKDLAVMMHISLKVSKQCAAAAQKENQALGMIKRIFALRSREVITKLYKSLVRLHLDYAMQVWSPHL